MPTVYITAPPAATDRIAQTLVDEQLAACVNSIPCRSTYRWDDEIHTDDEEILLAKTTDSAYPTLRDRVAELHPYDVPCIERFDETETTAPFSEWLADAVDSS